MNHHYADIRGRAGEPDWFDEHAVPRYGAFQPAACADIYAREIVLLQIACQGCGARFAVCMSQSDMGLVPVAEESNRWTYGRTRTLRSLVEADEIHYGDPPNTGCCAAGASMNSVPVRVLEFWDRGDIGRGRPVRMAELERNIACDWSEDAPDEVRS
jgi:hypothetical protein